MLEPTGRFVLQNRVRCAEDRVNRAAPLLENTIIGLRSDAVACTCGLPGCRISVTRDVARYSLDLISWCRGYDLSVYIVFADPKSQASKGLIFNFRFRRTLRASSQVVVGLANRDCPAICASQLVTAYISAAWRIGSDLTAGHPFPVVSTERFSGTVYLFEQPV